VQEEQFIAQIELANELGLPLMIHTRDAQGNQASAHSATNVYDDTYAILKQYAKVRGDIHFYAGNYEQARKFFDLGFTISFTGVITFAKDYEEVVRNAPLDMIHAETDCPYVAPKPYRGQRCEPSYVKEVYKKIAEIKKEDEEVVRLQLIRNAECLFKISL
jgi:TatD DNase family protein